MLLNEHEALDAVFRQQMAELVGPELAERIRRVRENPDLCSWCGQKIKNPKFGCWRTHK